jgi:TRAP-type C4-dicarboxylate transport system substrate-binding protein
MKGEDVMITKYLGRMAVIAAGFGSAISITPAAAAETTILFNNFAPRTADNFVYVVKPYLDDVERITKGRVKFVIPPQSLAPPPEQMNMVKTGVADGAVIFNAFLQKSHPLLQIALLPGTMRSAVAIGVAYWRTYEKFFAPKHPLNEVKLLGFFAQPPGHLYNIQKRPIESLDDLKGKKLWSLPGISAQALGLTGASIVPGSAARMYDVVSKGIVDAFCCINYEVMSVVKVMQYAGAVTEVDGGVAVGVFSLFISNGKWKQISREDQEAITAISGEAIARRAAKIDAHNEEIKKDYLAKGGVVVEANATFNDALKKAWRPLFDRWVADANKEGVDGRAALDYYLSQSAKVAGGM